MEWLTDVLGMGASAASGGVFGLLGSLTGSIFKYFKSKQEHQFKKDAWNHELKLQELQLQSSREENEHELAIVSQEGSWSSLEASMHLQNAAGESYRWVNAIKDLWRPLLTAGLLGCSMVLFKDMLGVLSGGSALSGVFSAGEAKEIVQYIVYSLVFASSTAITWWFADRALSPPGMKNR